MSKPSLRRVPQQARSQRRLDAIVQAAALRFADQGFEAATMEAIAADANTSIGSVYQFFPNKRALFRAVAERSLEGAGALFGRLVQDPDALASWSIMLDACIDGFARHQSEDPAFRAVLRNVELYGEYQEADEALLATISEATRALVLRWAPRLDEAVGDRVARTLVNTISMTLLAVAREDEGRRLELLGELRRMLRLYLSSYVEAEPAG